MNLTWHIVRKDLRRLRWLALGWIGVMVLRISLGLRLEYGGAVTPASLQQLHYLDSWLTVMQGVLVYLLASVLIHEEALVGSNVAWRARPIAGGRLLGAKLLGLAVLALVPVVLGLPWWLGNGFGWGDIAATAGAMVVQHAGLMLVALGIAVLTDGLPRFLAWTLVIGVAKVALTAAVAAGTFGSLPEASGGVADTRVVVDAAILVGGILMVVAIQFLLRRLWLAYLVTAVVLAASTVGVHGYWVWDWSGLWRRASAAAAPAGTGGDAVNLTVLGALPVSKWELPRTGETQTEIGLMVAAPDPPPGTLWRGATATATLEWSGGTQTLRGDLSGLLSGPALRQTLGVEGLQPPPDPETEASFRARAPTRHRGPTGPRTFQVWFAVGPETLRRIQEDPPRLSLEISLSTERFSASRRRLISESRSPFSEGWRIVHHSVEERGQKPSKMKRPPTTHVLWVDVVRVEPPQPDGLAGWPNVGRTPSAGLGADYYLVSPHSGRIQRSVSGILAPVGIFGVSLRLSVESFHAPEVVRQGAWQEVQPSDWLQDAYVVRVDRRGHDSCLGRAAIDRLVLPAEDTEAPREP